MRCSIGASSQAGGLQRLQRKNASALPTYFASRSNAGGAALRER